MTENYYWENATRNIKSESLKINEDDVISVCFPKVPLDGPVSDDE